MSTEACAQPAENHAAALTGRIGRAGRQAAQEALRRARWHLRQRRPRPQWGDSAIDHLIAAGRNLVLIAVIIAIGG